MTIKKNTQFDEYCCRVGSKYGNDIKVKCAFTFNNLTISGEMKDSAAAAFVAQLVRDGNFHLLDIPPYMRD